MRDPTPDALGRQHAGAPESLRRALRSAAAVPDIPRATRRELLAAASATHDGPRGLGIVPFPVVRPDGTGSVYRVIVTEQRRQDLAAIAVPEALRDALGALGPCEGLHAQLSGPAPGLAWTGRSHELALATALLSRALGIVPAPLVPTGTVEDGHVGPVQQVDAKASLVAQDLPDHHLDHPVGASLADAMDALLPGWRAAALGRRGAEAQLARARAAAGRADHSAVLELTASLLEHGDAAIAARAAWWSGAAALHAGDAATGATRLEQALQAVPSWHEHADDPPEELVREELEAWWVVALLDRGDVRAADAVAQQALASLASAGHATRRWRHVVLQLAGSGARAALARGDATRAAELLDTWSLGRAALRSERARCLGDRAEIDRHRGRLEEATRSLALAHEALPDADQPDVTARFLALYAARVACEHDPEPVRRVDGVWPGLGFRLLRTRTGDEELAALHAEPAVRASATLQGVVASEVAWHILHDGPAADRSDLLADAARWHTDDDALGALFRRLATAPDVAALSAWRRHAPYG